MIRQTADNPCKDAIRYLCDDRDFDPEARLHYTRLRHFDPTIGRWINDEPIGYEAGDVNLYRYVAGAPCNDNDPSG